MRAVIYARYSAGSGQTELSIEGQLRECKKYIEKKGYTLGEVYADRHVSGLSTKGREEFKRLMDDAKAHKFDVVVCYDTSRFARDKFDAVVYKTELRKRLGIAIEWATMNVEGPEGVLLEAIMEGWNQYFSEELSRKTKRGMAEAASKGLSLGSRPPLGYTLKDRRFVVDEAGAEAVREVFKAYTGGASFADCARMLNEQGFRTATGKPFNGSAVRYMLTNKKYLGIHGGASGVVPAIVDPEVFQAARDRIGERPPKSVKHDFALVGKLTCGCCGSRMTGTSTLSKGRRYYYYKCSNKCAGQPVRQDKLDSFVAACAQEALSKPEMVKEVAARLFAYQKKENPLESKIEALGKSLKSLDMKIDNLTTALAERPASKALLTRLDDLEEQREQVQRAIEAEPEQEPCRILSEQAIADGLAGLLAPLSDPDRIQSQERWILDSLVEAVELTPDEVLITYATDSIVKRDQESQVSKKVLIGTPDSTFFETMELYTAPGAVILSCSRSAASF